MPPVRTVPAVVVLLLVLAAFALGIAAERWMNGARRNEALRWYERAVREFSEERPPPLGRPGTGSVQE